MFFHFFQHWFSRCSNYSERQWSKYLLRNRHVIGGRATKKSDPEYGSLSQRIQNARPAHVPHVPLKFPHEPDQKFKSSIQPKLLISRADYRLKFIRLPFFFSDLIAPLRNRRHIVLAILGFANLMYTHAPIYSLYTTSAVTDRQFHLPGDTFFAGRHFFCQVWRHIFCRETTFFAGESDRPVTLFELVRVRLSYDKQFGRLERFFNPMTGHGLFLP